MSSPRRRLLYALFGVASLALILPFLRPILLQTARRALIPDIDTNPAHYGSRRAKWMKRGLTDHFPSAIPGNSTSTRFSEFPGFLQGGAWLQLRVTLSPAEADKIFEEASQRATAFYDGGGFFKLVNEQPEKGPAMTAFRTADSDESDFPEDYRVFIYDARPFEPREWRHGKSRGVVVSKQRHEVIYFAESW